MTGEIFEYNNVSVVGPQDLGLEVLFFDPEIWPYQVVETFSKYGIVKRGRFWSDESRHRLILDPTKARIKANVPLPRGVYTE